MFQYQYKSLSIFMIYATNDQILYEKNQMLEQKVDELYDKYCLLKNKHDCLMQEALSSALYNDSNHSIILQILMVCIIAICLLFCISNFPQFLEHFIVLEAEQEISKEIEILKKKIQLIDDSYKILSFSSSETISLYDISDVQKKISAYTITIKNLQNTIKFWEKEIQPCENHKSSAKDFIEITTKRYEKIKDHLKFLSELSDKLGTDNKKNMTKLNSDEILNLYESLKTTFQSMILLYKKNKQSNIVFFQFFGSDILNIKKIILFTLLISFIICGIILIILNN